MNLRSESSGTKQERQRLHIQVEITTLLPYVGFAASRNPSVNSLVLRTRLIFILKPRISIVS